MGTKSQTRNEEAPSVAAPRASNVDQLIRKGDNMNDSTTITTVPFHGHDLFLVEYEGQPYTPMKTIVEGMGMDWSAQARKLRGNASRWGVVKMTIPPVDAHNDAVCIPVRKLPGWLMTISPNKVKDPEVRERVIQYQNECDDALWDYWAKGVAINPRIPLTPEHQRGIQKAIARRAQSLPKGIQRLAYSRIYSHLKDRFGVGSYKDIEDGRYAEALGAIQSYELEGDFLAADPVPDLERLDIDYPLSSWPEINRNISEDFINRQRTGDYLVAPYHLFGESNHSPTRMVLATLERAGYRVDACKHELLALQIYLEGIIGRLSEIRSIAEGPRAFHRVRYMA